MENQDYIENSFIIDLSNAKDTLEIINELSNILEMTESKEKNICLKLRNVELSQSQLLSIRALINATGSTLAFLDANTERTISSANELGIKISTVKDNLTIEEKQIDEKISDSEENILSDEVTEETAEIEKTEEIAEISEEGNNTVDIPEFVTEEIKVDEEAERTGYISDVPSFEDLYPTQNEVSSTDVPYEIFKTEEMKDDTNKELPTLYLKQTLRSGQTLSYDGNILVIGDTHPGSELIAKGDITVWGVLGGIAHAGTSGDKKARIRALKLNAIQLRIAGIYAGRKNTENIPYIQRTNEFTPQEASIENDTLVIKSINNEL